LVDSLLPIEISGEILDEVFREARNAYPTECCGWLSGPKDSNLVTAIRRCVNDQSSATHRSIAGRTPEKAYNIAGSELLELARSLDSEAPAQVIYHSHSNGRAYFSDADQDVARWGGEPSFPVQQLVVGIDDQRVVEAALFAWSYDEGGFVEVARYVGANI